jgi:predicted ATPase with chaperone activity
VTETPRTLCCPPAPATLEAAGLSLDLVQQLTLKTLHFAGDLTGSQIAPRLGVAFSIVETALASLKSLDLCEIVGSGLIGGPSYRYRLTSGGRVRAQACLEQNSYVGEAPVPLAQYCRYMEKLAARPRTRITRERLRQTLAHLVLGDEILDQLGPATGAGRSMFIYGAPGNGKTAISQALRDLAEGDLAIPRAIEVEGNLIRVFNPVNHEVVEPPAEPNGLDAPLPFDARWIACRRPLVAVGGELKLETLDLQFSPVTRIYHAPVQMVAGGGVLLIDDFGRQSCPPRDLLNRWIVPLESRVDYLALQSGLTFSLPFTAFVIFATNLRPGELVDEAFLRRIQYKIRISSPTPEQFIRIFENCCRTYRLAFDRRMVEHLLDVRLVPKQVSLRGCHPRDLIQQALSLAAYREQPRELTLELLMAACDSYFVDEEPSSYS